MSVQCRKSGCCIGSPSPLNIGALTGSIWVSSLLMGWQESVVFVDKYTTRKSKAMTLESPPSIFSASMPTICMGGLWVKLYQRVALGGWRTTSCLKMGSLTIQPTAWRALSPRWTSEGLHGVHNAYPLAPECMVVPREWMSKYQHDLFEVELAPTKVDKMVPNLCNKEGYVPHYCSLQLCISMTHVFDEYPPCLGVRPEPWDGALHTDEHRALKQATGDFEKDLYKLMNNSVFGKTMEYLCRWVAVKLVHANEKDKLRRRIAIPAFARANIFNDGLAEIQVLQKRLVLNHPVYMGM